VKGELNKDIESLRKYQMETLEIKNSLSQIKKYS
jgi:hypothetical protein